jgi:exodeoxyribonuclease-5
LPESIIFAGFETVPPAIERLAATLDDRGCRVGELLPPRADARQTRLALADSTAELSAAAGWAVQRLRKHPEAHLGIICPDLAQRRSSVIRTLDTLLHPEAGTVHGSPPRRLYNLSLGAPLTEAPVVNDALLALRLLVSGVEFSEASTILRSPFLGDGESEFLSRSALESVLREGPDRRVTTHRLLRAAGNRCPALSRRVIKAHKLLDERSASPATWSVRFRAALSALGWPGERGVNSVEYQQTQRFRDLVDLFPSLATVTSAMDARRALASLSDMARQTTFQPETRTTGSIQVMGLLEADGQSFDGLWITGLSDQQFPPRGEPHPLLPVTLQRAHHMPHASAGDDLGFARSLLDRLLVAAPDVIDAIDTSSLYISAPMDEVDAPRLHVGQRARVTLDPWPERSFPARVARIAPYVLDLEQQNRTVEIEVELDDSAFSATLLPGTSADVEVVLEVHPDALRLPASVLLTGDRVLMLIDGLLEERPVEVGLRNWDWVEVLGGLGDGDRVVGGLERSEVRAGAQAQEAPAGTAP